MLTVSGTVQDAASLAGIVGATVSAQGLSTTTTTGGFFALGNLTQNPVALTVTAPAHQTYLTSVSVPGAALNVGTIYLAPTHVAGRGDVTGRALLSGVPTAGVSVLVNGVTQAVTNSAGQFHAYNLPPGVVALILVTSNSVYMAQKTVTIVADTTISAGDIALTSGPPPPPL